MNIAVRVADFIVGRAGLVRVPVHALVVCVVIGGSTQSTGSSKPGSLSVGELLDDYDRGDYVAVVGNLASRTQSVAAFAGELRGIASAWIVGGGPRDMPRRRLVVATVALEAARGLTPRANPRRARTTETQWDARRDLVEWACALLGTTPLPPAAERWWHLAAIAFLEESKAHPFYAWESYRADGHKLLAHAEARFPDESRFALAEVVLDEMAFGTIGAPLDVPGPVFLNVRVIEAPDAVPTADVVLAAGTGRDFPVDPRDVRNAIRRVVRGFAALFEDKTVGPEAHLRLGAIELYLHQADLALPHFGVTERRAVEPFLIYLARFFRGSALAQLGHVTDAETAYRAALEIAPYAESATVGLAWVLSVSQQRAAASALVAESLAAQPGAPDPWLIYRVGDARLWPVFLGRLRSAIRP